MPDDYGSKTSFIMLLLGGALFFYLLLTFIPFIDPFWKKIQPKYHIFLMFRDLAMLASLFFGVQMLLSAREGKVQTALLGVGLGVLFMLIGNYLPKLPRNFFFGIRTPWTLASDVVWKQTHIVSGWLFVCAGALIVLFTLLAVPINIAMLVTLGPTIIFSAFIYPWRLYTKLQRSGGDGTLPEL